jgi:tRNA-dihydrouridine synthase B
MMASCAKEKPVSIQIFGADPAIMGEAAAMVEETGADILDINFGCSVKKILKSGAGAALMKEPEKTKAILTKVRATIDIPITIKIRSGWDPSGDDAFNIAQIAENCGVVLIPEISFELSFV